MLKSENHADDDADDYNQDDAEDHAEDDAEDQAEDDAEDQAEDDAEDHAEDHAEDDAEAHAEDHAEDVHAKTTHLRVYQIKNDFFFIWLTPLCFFPRISLTHLTHIWQS